MTAISTVRHQSIFNPSENNIPINIIGAGATGSRVFMGLVELGLTQITVYDFDTVEPHNLANQIYDACDVGKLKVEACRTHAERKIGVADLPPTMKFVNKRVGDGNWPEMPGVIFLLTDTMASRREIYNHYVDVENPEPFLVIETRMASSFGNVNVFTPFNKAQCKKWVDSLVDDDAETTEVSPCGASISVGPTASIIASFAVWQFITALTNPVVLNPQMEVFALPPMIA